jgi:CheY-like chemotaxis protein
MVASAIGQNSLLRSASAPKARLLLVADSAERLKWLKSSLGGPAFEVSCAGSMEELRATCGNQHDLVALDLDATQVKVALSHLRENALHANTPLLVETSRLGEDRSLAGVLPAFRAMPCSRNDLSLLARFYSEGGQREEPTRATLL